MLLVLTRVVVVGRLFGSGDAAGASCTSSVAFAGVGAGVGVLTPIGAGVGCVGV